MKSDTFEKIIKSVNSHKSFVLVTVTEAFGSTPAKPGFRMIVFENGEHSGTVGGGSLEKAALNQSIKLLKEGGDFLVKRYNLETELKMACGGNVNLFYEVHAPWVLSLIGGGHVASKTAPLAKDCGFEVEIFDNRKEIKENFLDDIKVTTGEFSEILSEVPTGNRHMAIVMTYDHIHDKDAIELLIHKDFKYLGLIGSRRKASTLKKYLTEKGVAEKRINFIRTPVGMPIGAENISEIAVSIVAELIAVRAGKELIKW